MKKHRDHPEYAVDTPAAQLIGKRDFSRLAEPVSCGSKACYGALQENIPVALFRTVSDGRILNANSALIEMFRYESANDLMVVSAQDLYAAPEDRQRFFDRLRAEGKLEGFEARFKRKNGTFFWGSLSAGMVTTRDETLIFCDGILQDITERKLAEEMSDRRLKENALRNSERQLADIINFLPDPTWVIDAEGRVVVWNRAIEKMTGVNAENILGKGDYEYAVPLYGIRRPLLIDLVLKQDKHWEKQYSYLSKKGDALVSAEAYHPLSGLLNLYLSASAAPLYDSEGNVAGAIETLRDITEKKCAEEALRKVHEDLEQRVAKRTAELFKSNERLKGEIEDRRQAEKSLEKSERKYRSLVENINDVIFSTDRNGIITYISPAIKPISEYDPSEMIGHHFMEFIFKDDRQDFEDHFKFDVHVSKGIEGELGAYEYRIVTKSGKIRWVKSSARPKREGDAVVGARGILSDITLTKLLQDELIRSERLAATGQLAASVAHEINSPLQGIIALLNVIRKSYPENEKLLNDLGLLTEAFANIRNIAKDLLDLNRPAKQKKQRVDVNAVIKKRIALLRYYLTKNAIKVKFNPSCVLPEINASPQQLGQVFMNLLNNAVEAIRGESDAAGEITIGTSCEEEHVIIEIADSGSGICENDLPRIFDSFYTCKKNMGLGVGLSICRSIIEDHGGSIAAANLPEGGALFTITLPVKS